MTEERRSPRKSPKVLCPNTFTLRGRRRFSAPPRNFPRRQFALSPLIAVPFSYSRLVSSRPPRVTTAHRGKGGFCCGIVLPPGFVFSDLSLNLNETLLRLDLCSLGDPPGACGASIMGGWNAPDKCAMIVVNVFCRQTEWTENEGGRARIFCKLPSWSVLGGGVNVRSDFCNVLFLHRVTRKTG
jgi:hypothetical protein